MNYKWCTEEDYGDVAASIYLSGGAKRVIIASPMWPNVYLDSSNCHWDFRAYPNDKKIRISVISWEASLKLFYLEACINLLCIFRLRAAVTGCMCKRPEVDHLSLVLIPKASPTQDLKWGSPVDIPMVGMALGLLVGTGVGPGVGP